MLKCYPIRLRALAGQTITATIPVEAESLYSVEVIVSETFIGASNTTTLTIGDEYNLDGFMSASNLVARCKHSTIPNNGDYGVIPQYSEEENSVTATLVSGQNIVSGELLINVYVNTESSITEGS